MFVRRSLTNGGVGQPWKTRNVTVKESGGCITVLKTACLSTTEDLLALY